jgi:hypothetical protein
MIQHYELKNKNKSHTGGVMDSVLASSAVYCGFKL